VVEHPHSWRGRSEVQILFLVFQSSSVVERRYSQPDVAGSTPAFGIAERHYVQNSSVGRASEG
jgi:hypothetical protein